MQYYTTLDDVVTQLDIVDQAAFDATTNAEARIAALATNTKGYLSDLIPEMSERLAEDKHRDFVPYVDTLEVYAVQRGWHDGWDYGLWSFWLYPFFNRDLLSISSVVLDGTTLNASYYRIDTSDGYPSQKIIFDRDYVTIPTSYTFSTALKITGTWGYHKTPDTMWKDSADTVQDNPLGSSATSLTVTDADNFETFQYLKIEDEFLLVTALNTSTNVLTVERGVRGTTAASHANDTAIYTYQQSPEVRKETRRLVARELHLRNGVNVVGRDGQEANNEKIQLKIPIRWAIGSVK